MGKINRQKQRCNRKRKRQEQSTKPLKIFDATKDPFSDFGDHNYKEQTRDKMRSWKEYVHGNNLHQSQNGLTLVRPKEGLPVVVVSSSLQMDARQGTAITKICPSDHGLNLDQRCAKGLGLKSHESFEVRWDGIDGELIVLMLRNVFTAKQAKAADIFKQAHAMESKGWNRGCEADIIPRENAIRRQINNPAMILGASGVNPNNSLVRVGPGGIGKTTGVKAFYHNGEREVPIPLCSFIDRMKWGRKGNGFDYERFLKRSDKSASDFFEKLKSTYINNCVAFMGEKHSNCLDQVEGSLLMNTNIIDDKDSVMGIHKDPTTPTPALVTGPGNYIFDEEEGEWILSHNGGRLFLAEGLFWIDYRPTDVALFDGNVPHGVSRMRPLGADKSQTVMYQRFSLILFSRYGRMKMKKHGHFRHHSK